MPNYNEEFTKHVADIIKLSYKPFILKYYAILLFPTVTLYELGNGIAFSLFFILCCVFGRSAKIGGILGWFIVAITIFLYFISPENGHFIEHLLRAPATAHSNSISSEQVNNMIPETISLKIFLSLLFALRGGMTIGLGIGWIGNLVWGCHPKMSK